MSHHRRLTLATLRLLAALALFGCFGICGGGPTPPPPDACSQPSMGSVDSVELAAPRIDPTRFGPSAARDDLPPRLLADQAPVYPVRGGQGAEMVGVLLVLKGADVPPCIAQDTQVNVGGQLAARNRETVATYPLAGGGRVTKTIWLPGAFSGAATLSSDVVGKKPSLNIVTTDTDNCGATASCPCSAMQNGGGTFRLSDAGRALWTALDDCRSSCDAGSGSGDAGSGPGSCEEDGGVCEAAARACFDDLY